MGADERVFDEYIKKFNMLANEDQLYAQQYRTIVQDVQWKTDMNTPEEIAVTADLKVK